MGSHLSASARFQCDRRAEEGRRKRKGIESRGRRAIGFFASIKLGVFSFAPALSSHALTLRRPASAAAERLSIVRAEHEPRK